jgi:hypothetical protein
MIAFHGDIKIQKKYIARVKKHYKLDEIVQGKYWDNGKGCAVGCTIENDDVSKTNSGWHQRYEEALGIPRQIALLEDKIFEGLSNAEAKEFPLRFLKAVNVGADLSMVIPKFFVWLLGDEKDGVIKFAKGYKSTEKAIKGVLKLYQETVGGKTVKKERWIKAKNAAYAAYDADAADAAADAAYAAYAYAAYAYAAYDADAAYTYAAYAAYDADAAAYAAADADAADAAAYAAAHRKHYTKMADKLIEILQDTR